MSAHYQRQLAQIKDGEHPFAQYVRILGKGKTGSRSLSTEQAQTAMAMILNGQVEDIQLGAFLMLLRVKEESFEELTGFVRAVRGAIKAPSNIAVDLDWSSYAGKKRQLPWYLLSCFVLADHGVRLYMHGAAGHTPGRLYTADVLAQLGIDQAQDWSQVEEQLANNCFAFMPLQSLCPTLKTIIDYRPYLGLRSPVHTLARLINPLAASHSMQSIFHPAYADSHQQAAIQLGQQNAAVFKGEGGEIERKPEANCLVKQVIDGKAAQELWPKLLQGRQQQDQQLQVEDLVTLWRGTRQDEYAQQAIIGTIAIALRLMNRAPDPAACLCLAEDWWQQRNKNRL